MLTETAWENYLSAYPEAHLLQTLAWGQVKSRFGWQAHRLAVQDAGAQVLLRSLPLGFKLAYIPKGPVGADWSALWPALDAFCRRQRCVFLKVEPDGWEDQAEGPAMRERLPGFIPSPQIIQPPRTVVVDLQGSEEDILMRMKQKTRYNIRLAEKKEVIVRPSTDLEGFHRLMQATGARDGFSVHSLDYYRQVYDRFYPQGACELLQAEYEGQPLAALMVLGRGQRAWYLYGASTDLERSRMPAYLLQWQAMRWARQHGCLEYDLWGVPDMDESSLEAQFADRADGLWGVYRFKRGFGGQVRRSHGAWDKVYLAPLYAVYRWRLARSGSA